MQDLTGSQIGNIGIVAGAGPDAGITFWRKLLVAQKRQAGTSYRGDLDAPRVRVVSEPLLGLVTNIAEHESTIRASLTLVLQELDDTCDMIVVACHALQAMSQETGLTKILSLPDLVATHASQFAGTRIGLLGAPSVVRVPSKSPYAALWNVADVEIPQDPDLVLADIVLAKQIGANHPDVRRKVTQHIAAFSAEVVYLACTDFSEQEFYVPGKVVVDILDLGVKAIMRNNEGGRT